jgi:hypothetical protein
VPSPQQQLLLQQQAQRQALMNQAAGQLGNAIGEEIGKALFGDPEEEAAERARAAAAAQAAELARMRAEAEAQARSERLQSDLLIGTGSDASASMSMMTGTTGDLPMTLPVQAPAPTPSSRPAEPVERKALAALDCAMQEIYGHARLAGAQGNQFADELRQEVAGFRGRAIQPAGGTGESDVGVSSLTFQRQIAVVKDGASVDGQFIVDATIANHGDGLVRVMVNSHVAGPGGSLADEAQTVVSIDRDGKATIEADAAPEVSACLGRNGI